VSEEPNVLIHSEVQATGFDETVGAGYQTARRHSQKIAIFTVMGNLVTVLFCVA